MGRASHLSQAYLIAVLLMAAGCKEKPASPRDPGGRTPTATPKKGREPPSPDGLEGFKIRATVEPGEGPSLVSDVLFLGDHAVTFGDSSSGEPDVIFDTRERSWHDVGRGSTMRLDDCEAWAKASLERSRVSAERTLDGPAKQFALAVMSPKYEVKEIQGGLLIRDAFLKWTLTQMEQVPIARRARLYAYDELNAYHKAMTRPKLPPFPQLEVLRILKERGVWPRRIEMVVRTPAREILMAVRYESLGLDAVDRARVGEALRRLRQH